MKQYIDLIKRIARRYTLPPKCAITHDDLIQEGCLGYLEAQIEHPEAEEKKWLNYARKAMQQAIARYVSPVTRSLDSPISPSPSGEGWSEAPITLADTIADDSAADSNLSLAPERPPVEAGGVASAEEGYACTIEALLTPRQQLILHRLFAEGKTASEVARELGTSPVRIRVIKHELLRKLKKSLK